MQPLKSIIVTLYTALLSSVMLLRPGKSSKVYASAKVQALLPEGAQNNTATNLAVCLLLDYSPSTGNPMPDGQGSIMDSIKEAARLAVEFLSKQVSEGNARHYISVVRFNHTCEDNDVLLPLTLCDSEGTARALSAVNTLATPERGGTSFAPAINRGIEILNGSPAGCLEMLVKFTDGENMGVKDEAIRASETARRSEIDFRLGALGLASKDRAHCEELAKDGFKPLTQASDVNEFFVGAALMSRAAITNARLTITPPENVKVFSLARVLRGTGDNEPETDFLDAPQGALEVKIGGIEPGQFVECCFGLDVTQPESLKPGRRSFGKLILTGDVPSEGLVGVVLTEQFIQVNFGNQITGKPDANVLRLINMATAQRELALYAQTNSPENLQKARATLAMDNSQAAATLLKALEGIESSGDAATAAKRATQGFDAKAAADALKNMM